MRRVFRIPFSRSHLVRDVDDEIAFHLQSRMDSLVESGMNATEARSVALRQFGDLTTVRDEMLLTDRQHDTVRRRVNLFSELRQDVHSAPRPLPTHALVQ